MKDNEWILIIERWSCTNFARTLLAEKLNLKWEKHPKLYKLHWQNDCGEVKDKKQVRVPFLNGKYEDERFCDEAPKYACHILLHQPWKFDRRVSYYAYKNCYYFVMKYRNVVLAPLKFLQAYEDKIRIEKECKMMEK